jgi:hypothetical protein
MVSKSAKNIGKFEASLSKYIGKLEDISIKISGLKSESLGIV